MKPTIKSILFSTALATASLLTLGSTAAYAFDCKCWTSVKNEETGRWERIGTRPANGPLENSDRNCSDLNDYYTEKYEPTTKDDPEAKINLNYCKPVPSPSPSPSPSQY